MTYVTTATAFGPMMVAASDRGISFVQFADEESELLRMLKSEYPQARLARMIRPHHPNFRKWMSALREHLSGNQPHLSLPLDIRATAFQMRVWKYLQSIPYGKVESYGEVAASIGQPTALGRRARLRSNKTAILIPCHRVIRGTGELADTKWVWQGREHSSTVNAAIATRFR